jgi:hypothetical protein
VGLFDGGDGRRISVGHDPGYMKMVNTYLPLEGMADMVDMVQVVTEMDWCLVNYVVVVEEMDNWLIDDILGNLSKNGFATVRYRRNFRYRYLNRWRSLFYMICFQLKQRNSLNLYQIESKSRHCCDA